MLRKIRVMDSFTRGGLGWGQKIPRIALVHQLVKSELIPSTGEKK
jgi:hypothetical protein